MTLYALEGRRYSLRAHEIAPLRNQGSLRYLGQYCSRGVEDSSILQVIFHVGGFDA